MPKKIVKSTPGAKAPKWQRTYVPADMWERRMVERKEARDKRAAHRRAQGLPVEHYEISTEDLRDDVVSVIINSGLSDVEIAERCGPVPSTLRAWRNKTVAAPWASKMRAALRACGHDFGIIQKMAAE